MTNRVGALFDSHRKDLIAAVALLWAALLVAVPGTLSGTEHAGSVFPMLVVGVAGCVVIVAAGVRTLHG